MLPQKRIGRGRAPRTSTGPACKQDTRTWAGLATQTPSPELPCSKGLLCPDPVPADMVPRAAPDASRTPAVSFKPTVSHAPVSPPSQIPAGFRLVLYEPANRRGVVKYQTFCQHGSCLLDRPKRVAAFLARHAACEPCWQPLARRPEESDAQHEHRLGALFSFSLPRKDSVPRLAPSILPAKRRMCTPAKQQKADRDKVKKQRVHPIMTEAHSGSKLTTAAWPASLPAIEV